MWKNKKEKAFCFTGPLAGPISSFFEEMRLSGYVYNEAGYYLRQIARNAEQEDLKANCLTKEFVESWCQKREYESHKTWSSRVTIIRKLADYMDLRGLNTYRPSIKKLDPTAYEKKVREQLDKELGATEKGKNSSAIDNTTLAYKLRDISGEWKGELLGSLLAFQPEDLLPNFQESRTKTGKDDFDGFKNLIRKNMRLQELIGHFWDVVVRYLNDSLKRLEQELIAEGAEIHESGNAKEFFVVLDERSIEKPLVRSPLVSECGSKEYFLNDFTLIFRGYPDMFPENDCRYLTVLEREGRAIHCWKFIDTQGLFHVQKATSYTEATRIQDMLAGSHSYRMILILDSRISDTSKNGDGAISRLLSDINANLELYFIYTHWDLYLKDFQHKVPYSPVGRPRREKVNWDKRFEEKKSLQKQRHEGFQESLSRNGNKRRPSICGQVSSAILNDQESPAETLLEKENITDKKSLTALLGEILKKERESGQKFRVTKDLEGCFTLNTGGLGVVSIKALYKNLNACKTGRLYASTVRACVRKWRYIDDVHKSDVIETAFVQEIRNLVQNFLVKRLEFDLTPYLCEPSDADQASKALTKVMTGSLGCEVAKEIGERAYHGGFEQPIPGTPFPYQYERLHHMFEYTQEHFFNTEDVSLSQEFQEILQVCVKNCLKLFVDENCILVM